ncbi:MAG: ATP-binding cassette domain-containing protein [Deltaproteobacteria bacterium]|jgi:phospholipid/cholesterol/gamma-HCH transport system ATP-binding protein|nr:ATP-binding cassette domain-containing protein [Deltaproteobacteria bacterium]
MEQPLSIELKNCTMGYGNFVVLKNISLQIPAGRIVAILGGSGGGKTTLLRHITGLNRPFSGEIFLEGKSLWSQSGRDFQKLRGSMGVLFQDGALLGQLTVAENVGLRLSELTKLNKKTIREIALYYLSLVDLADYAEFYPTELSGGMRKRVGLARALVAEPPILLCDEPTSGLDPINAAKMDELLLSMKERFPAMTIVSISHDLASVHKTAAQVVVLNEGHIAYNGNFSGLENTQDPFLRQFIERKVSSDKQEEALEKSLPDNIRQLMYDSLKDIIHRS